MRLMYSHRLLRHLDYVRGGGLKEGQLQDDQRDFLTGELQNRREGLIVFLDFTPQGKLEEARRRIEEENVANVDELNEELDRNAGIYNPVILPWKNRVK